MFDFLFQKKNKEMQSMAEVIALDLEKLNLSKLAIEKAVMMIARAIANILKIFFFIKNFPPLFLQ